MGTLSLRVPGTVISPRRELHSGSIRPPAPQCARPQGRPNRPSSTIPPDGLRYSEAGQGHVRSPTHDLPYELPDQLKRTEGRQALPSPLRDLAKAWGLGCSTLERITLGHSSVSAHPYQGSPPGLVSPRMAPASCANDVPGRVSDTRAAQRPSAMAALGRTHVRRGVQQPGEWTGGRTHRRGWFQLGGRAVRRCPPAAATSRLGRTAAEPAADTSDRFRRCRPWLLPGIPDTADSAPHPPWPVSG
jgi:hypothetical protein